jgi:hypothetical protein
VLAASLDCPLLMTPSLLLTFIDSLYNKGDYCLLFNPNSAFFKLYHGENKLIFIEMMLRSTLF